MSAAGSSADVEIPTLSPAPRVLIVAAAFYRDLTDLLIDGARARLQAAAATIDVIEAPGALEVPTAISYAAEHGGYDGFVALGCVIRGETTHYELVCGESARGLTLLGLERGLAIGNGILTVESEAQARRRADPADMDKGGGAATACLWLIGTRRRFAPARRGGGEPLHDPILLA